MSYLTQQAEGIAAALDKLPDDKVAQKLKAEIKTKIYQLNRHGEQAIDYIQTTGSVGYRMTDYYEALYTLKGYIEVAVWMLDNAAYGSP